MLTLLHGETKIEDTPLCLPDEMKAKRFTKRQSRASQYLRTYKETEEDTKTEDEEAKAQTWLGEFRQQDKVLCEGPSGGRRRCRRYIRPVGGERARWRFDGCWRRWRSHDEARSSCKSWS